MVSYELAKGLAAALAAGLLVGMQRGWTQRERPPGGRIAGFRTFGLMGLLGGLAALAPDGVAAALAAAGGAALVVGYYREAARDALSATTVIAGLLTVAAGFAAVRISAEIGLAAGAAAFVILSARTSMHALLKGLDETEIEGVARFVLVALVILPFLPDADMGPMLAWNPRRIWLVVVMVTGFSFIGYVASRRFGQRQATLVMAATGALVSSTAVTAECARRLRQEPEAIGPLTAGIALASVVMFLRVQVLTLALAPRAAPMLFLAMVPATLVGAACALLALRRRGDGIAAIRLGNPFSFGPALTLAALVAALSVAARWALERFGDEGIAVVLGLTGMTDVDAAIVTLSGLPAGMVDDRTAGLVLAIPVLANTVVKAVMTVVLAGPARGWRASAPLWAATVASGALLLAWR